MELNHEQQQKKDADQLNRLTTRQVIPRPKHIKQARSFHRVLVNKGYSMKDKASILQALMEMLQGKR